MFQSYINFLIEASKNWLNSERQDKIISFQIFLILILFIFIYFFYHKHKDNIFELQNFIEKGQEMKRTGILSGNLGTSNFERVNSFDGSAKSASVGSETILQQPQHTNKNTRKRHHQKHRKE
jgi:hypothetical protein